MTIKFATANYTGGGIYEYVGILDDGKYFITNDEWNGDGDMEMGFTLVDEFPNDEQMGDADWQDKHHVGDVYSDGLFNEMLDWIISHNIKGNYLVSDLESRKIPTWDGLITLIYDDKEICKTDNLAILDELYKSFILMMTEIKGDSKVLTFRADLDEIADTNISYEDVFGDGFLFKWQCEWDSGEFTLGEAKDFNASAFSYNVRETLKNY